MCPGSWRCERGTGLQTFSKYSILKKLGGAGSHSTAFEARQGGLDRTVELRILNRRIQEDQPAYQRFQREFRVLAALDHPALIKVLDLGTADGRVYYTTDLREAETLGARLDATRGGFDADQVLDWLLPVGDALALLHSKGVLHRDVCLDAVKIDAKNDRAYLATFALLKILKLPSLTEKGFQAPEGGAVHTPEAQEGWPETERTDLYLLGTVIYQCLTGRRLPSSLDALKDGGAGAFEFEPPSERARGLSSQLDKAILSALAYNPEDRPESIQHFLSVLRRKRQLLEAKNVARTVGLKSVEAKPEEEELEDAEVSDEEKSAEEAFKDSSKEVVGEAIGHIKDWIEDEPANKKKAAGALAVCVALSLGTSWLMTPGPVSSSGSSGGGHLARYRRARGKRKASSKVEVKKEIQKAADEALQQATTPETFEKRWSAFKAFVKILPRDVRLKNFPPSVMANLRVGYYRSPEKASEELDALLTKARDLAAKE